MKNDLTSASKFLSFVLRHDPGAIGIVLDREGWTDIDALVDASIRSGRTIDRALVLEVVASNDKKRFAVSDDGRRIRAVQGHTSEDVQIERVPIEPPATLFHGTATRFLESIMRDGLMSGQRHHVHLSADPAIAKSVGIRHGKPVVLRVEASRMHSEGHAFYRVDNGVWLCEHVPPSFLHLVGDG